MASDIIEIEHILMNMDGVAPDIFDSLYLGLSRIKAYIENELIDTEFKRYLVNQAHDIVVNAPTLDVDNLYLQIAQLVDMYENRDFEPSEEEVVNTIQDGINDDIEDIYDIGPWIAVEEPVNQAADFVMDKKPGSVREILENACIKFEPLVKISTWRQRWRFLSKSYMLDERVGIDKCSVRFNEPKVDAAKFFDKINERLEADNNEYPIVKVSRDIKKAVNLTGAGTHEYEKIEIILDSYTSFKFAHNNIKVDDENKPDYYSLDIKVVPDLHHKELGNLRNYTVDMLDSHIEYAINRLYEEFGVEIDYDTMKLKRIEINTTFHMNCSMSDLCNSLAFYQNFTKLDSRKYNVANKKSKNGVDYTNSAYTGLGSIGSTIKVKLYDKALETAIAYNKANEGRSDKKLYFEDYELEQKPSLVRLEFELYKKEELEVYFDNLSLCSLTQNDIQKAFDKLVNKFFIRGYEKYYDNATKNIKRLLDSIDTSDRKWKTTILKELLSEGYSGNSTPILLNEVDINGFIDSKPLFKVHPARYKKILMELLAEANIYPRFESDTYDILGNFFLRIYAGQLSNHRLIVYMVDSDPGDVDELDEQQWHMEVEREIAEELENY